MVQVIHSAVKGRARYKVDGLYHSESLKLLLEQGLAGREGILSISVNMLTGTVLVLYDSGNGHNAWSLATILEGVINAHRPQAATLPKAAEENDRAQSVDRTERGLSGKPAGSAKPVSGHRRAEKLPNIRKVRKQVVNAEEQPDAPWHCMTRHDILQHWGSSASHGLSDEAAQRYFQQYGPNILPESVPRSGWDMFFNQFKSLPVGLLGVAAVISAATGGLADAVVILGVVVINATIGYKTESQTEKTIQGLKTLVQPEVIVNRDNTLQVLSSKDVVPGDVLVLRPGIYIAADARLLEVKHLSVDESALTGESMPVTKSTGTLAEREIPLGDRTNMVYMGTLVTGGQGLAVVIATSSFTEMGKIQTLVGEARPPETPMERQMDKMGVQLVIISGAVCGIVFVIGILRGYGFLQMLKMSIALAVAAVPEGLPTIATTTLALGIRRMRELNVLIRHLDAVEALGAVQTICLDKTGTITMNRMSIVQVHAGVGRIDVTDGKFRADKEVVNPYTSDDLLRLIHLSVLCNESSVSKQEGEFIVEGSSTENAFIHMAISAGVDVQEIRSTVSCPEDRPSVRGPAVHEHDTQERGPETAQGAERKSSRGLVHVSLVPAQWRKSIAGR